MMGTVTGLRFGEDVGCDGDGDGVWEGLMLVG